MNKKVVWTEQHTEYLKQYSTTENTKEYNQLAKLLYPVIFDMVRVTYITYYRYMYSDKNQWVEKFKDWASDVLVNLKKFDAEKSQTQASAFSFVLSTIKNRIKTEQYQINHYGKMWERPIQTEFEEGFDYIENCTNNIWTTNDTGNEGTKLIVEFVKKELNELENMNTKKHIYYTNKKFLETFLDYVYEFGLKGGAMATIINYIQEKTGMTYIQIIHISRKYFHYEHRET